MKLMNNPEDTIQFDFSKRNLVFFFTVFVFSLEIYFCKNAVVGRLNYKTIPVES